MWITIGFGKNYHKIFNKKKAAAAHNQENVLHLSQYVEINNRL